MAQPRHRADPPPQRPKPSEKELERQHLRFMSVVETVKTGIRWTLGGLTVVGTAYSAFYLPVQASAGMQTVITNAQSIIGNLNASVWVSWAVTAGTAVAVEGMRRKMLKERKEKDARIRELEQKIDPKVSSSRVDVAGKPVQEATQ